MASTSHLAELAAEMPLDLRLFINHRSPGLSPRYRVLRYWSLNLYACSGQVTFPPSSHCLRFAAGSAILMPPGTERRFHFDSAGMHLAVHFHPGQAVSADAPCLVDGRGRWRALQFQIEQLLEHQQPDRRRAILWQLLWTIEACASQPPTTSSGDARFDAARRYIDRHLSDPIDVGEIVAAAGCSANQLTRLFHQYTGLTVVAALRQARMQRTAVLLRETDLPIGAIGSEVGIPDPHHFNKAVRRHFGCAPSILRQQAVAQLSSVGPAMT